MSVSAARSRSCEDAPTGASVVKTLALWFAAGLFLAALVGLSQTVLAANPAGMTVPLNQVCTSAASVSGIGAADTVLVNQIAGKNIYVCDVELSAGAAAATAQLEWSAANTCTSPTLFGTLWNLAINSLKIAGNSYWRGQTTGLGNALCVHTTGTGPTSVTVFYDQY